MARTVEECEGNRLRNSTLWSARVSCSMLVRKLALRATVGSSKKGGWVCCAHCGTRGRLIVQCSDKTPNER